MISVIIPTFNRAPMLAAAVDSVFSQSLLPAEVIIVDDGSTDDTEQGVLSLGAAAPVAVRYLRQPNRGPAAARNAGIIMAGEKILAFLDADDQWHYRKLETQYRAMTQAPEYLLSHTRETWYRRGRLLNQKRRHQPPHGAIFERCLPLCCVGMSTVMARRVLFDQFGMFDESLRCCEDYDLWLRVAAHCPFLLIEQALTIKHGGRDDQVSVRYRLGMDRFRIQALGTMLQRGDTTGRHRRLLVEEMTRKCVIYGRGCLKHGKQEEGRHYLRLARWAALQGGPIAEAGAGE